jgi:formamidopyrimidine-DNA glycosylase
MPELPEVETIARGLQKTIVGKRIQDIRTICPDVVKQPPRIFHNELLRRKVKGVRRRGKYLLIDLSGGKTLLVHLGMTGNFLFAQCLSKQTRRSSGHKKQVEQFDKHDHVVFEFTCGEKQLRYNDQRKFGKMKVFNTGEEESVPELRRLGPEALEVDPYGFVGIFKSRKTKIKSALLNQQIIAGLGNIYADESLFEARINPTQITNTISERKLRDLHHAVKKVLRKAIRAGGSSIDNYLNVDGEIGRFQLQHKVYGREGEPCKKCGAKIKRIKISQRSSYFCPRCQLVRRSGTMRT